MKRIAEALRVLSGLMLVALALGALPGCGDAGQQQSPDAALAQDLVGTWFAYSDNAIDNMWTFRTDGSCVNDGWPLEEIGRGSLPYQIEGTYSILEGRIEAVMRLSIEGQDTTVTFVLEDPMISDNRLVYNAGGTPFVFLRERAAVAAGSEPAAQTGGDENLGERVIGSWVAFANRFPVNTWRFNPDGSFSNEGWTRMGPALVKRRYQVQGTYEVSGKHIVLTNQRILQFDPETSERIGDDPNTEQMRLYNIVVTGGRLIYTNEVGLPQVFRRGEVTPTNW